MNEYTPSKYNSPKEYINKAGEALKYGMLTEIQLMASRKNTSCTSLYGCITYLYLNEYISKDTALEANLLLRIHTPVYTNLTEFMKTFSSVLFTDLLEHFKFNNFDELVSLLNEHFIEDWYFDIGHEVIDSCRANAFLYYDTLYYISTDYDDSRKALCLIEKENIDSDTELDIHSCDRVICREVTQLYGFDNVNAKAYLKLFNNEQFYCCYDTWNLDLSIHPYRFFETTYEGNFLIDTNNNLILVKDGKETIIQKYDYSDNYARRIDHFLVSPESFSSRMFKPYKLNYDGTRQEASIKEANKFLIEYIITQLQRHEYGLPFSKKASFSIGLDETPDKLTINSLRSIYEENIDEIKRNNSKECIIFEDLMDLLEKYVDTEDDISDVFYELCDSFKKIRDIGSSFPGQKLFKRVKDLEKPVAPNIPSLEELIKHTRSDITLSDLIVKEEDKSNFDYSFEEDTTAGMIGSFLLKDDSVIANPGPIQNGAYVGSQVIPRSDLSSADGFVSYDTLNNGFIITSRRLLTEPERWTIMCDFNLKNAACTYYVQAIPNDKKTSTEENSEPHFPSIENSFGGFINMQDMFDDLFGEH